MTDNYVNLHAHSWYSLLDGIDSPTTLVEAAAKLGQPGLALSDHGSLAGHRELYRAADEHGIKPVFAQEAYYSMTDRFDKRTKANRQDGTDIYNHIVLIANNQRGYENLSEMSRRAWTEGFYHKPRCDKDLLFEYSEGITVLTACYSGVPISLIENDRYDQACSWLDEFKHVFGENLYVEVQAHNGVEINDKLSRMAQEVGVEMVATSDCHRAYKQDKGLQEAFLALGTNPDQAKGTNYKDIAGMDLLDAMDTLYPDRTMTFKDFNLYVQGRDEIEADFAGWGGSEIFDNTLKILDKVEDYTYHKSRSTLPQEHDDPDDELENMCLLGMHERGVATKEYEDRLNYELEVIKQENFSNYFIIVQDVVQWCEDNNILVAPGRGSASSSIVCYVLGITEVDPLKYDLLFERFLNADRNDFPDIDLDVEKAQRYRVKQYVKQKYGHTANIITYGHYSDKAAIKAACRVLSVPYSKANKLTSKVSGFEDYQSSDDEFVAKFRKVYTKVLPLAKRLEGRVSQSGMHAGGVVISNQDITKFAPVETKKDPDTDERVEVAALDMTELEKIGFVKFDFLGNKALDVVHETADRVGMSFDDIRNIPLEDTASLDQFDQARTVGSFQFDTNPSRHLFKQFPVRSFHDVVIANALIRPGAMNTVGKDYIARANGEQEVSTVHPILDDITKDSMNLIISQEQVMLTAMKLGGMSGSDADHLRKIIGKKQDPQKFAQYKQSFIGGATQHISRADANKLWSDFEHHSDYSFNSAHSVAYSMISMWTMWLRINHPQVYMAAFLRHQDRKEEIARILIESRNMGVPPYLPDVNESGKTFEEYKDGVRFGLCDIKYISDKSHANITGYRPYDRVDELYEVKNTKYSGVGSRQVEALELTGALKTIGGPDEDDASLYEYLGLPTFEVPEAVDASKVTPTTDFDENEAFVLSGMVYDVRREQYWTLIKVMDDHGTIGFFDDGGSSVKSGEYYYFVVDNNRVERMLTAAAVTAEIESGGPSALTEYLTKPTMDLLGDRTRYVLSIDEGRTRAGKRKATVVAAGKQGVSAYKVYSNTYGKVMTQLQERKAFDFRVSQTHWGATVINEVR